MIPRLFIIDTNILVAGLISSRADSPTARVLDAMLDGRLVYVMSPALLHEYRLVLLRPKLARLHGLDEMEVDRLLTELTANAVWREPLTSDEAVPAPDPGDEHVWALLASEPASILVTGDRLLLESPCPGCSVISASACVGMMG
jgi:putative PIN family toxin of toxin-antitoxin system